MVPQVRSELPPGSTHFFLLVGVRWLNWSKGVPVRVCREAGSHPVCGDESMGALPTDCAHPLVCPGWLECGHRLLSGFLL
jgi:hypothetical protein